MNSPRSSSKSPTRGKYYIQNPAGYLLLRLSDAFCGILSRINGAPPRDPIAKPGKILVSNGAHLGDVFLSTGILRVLKEAFPDAEIGFLTGSWSRQILEDHPLVDHLHLVDHWKLNRSQGSRWRKMIRYLSMRKATKKAIERIGYDLAIDLYCHFPNNIPLLYQAGIPVRIGYTSGGFGALLTHSLDWKNENRSILWYEKELVRIFLRDSREPPSYSPFFNPDSSLMERIRSKISGAAALEEPYLVFHMGSGSTIKEWPISKWKSLGCLFSERQVRIVLTGVGKREKGIINAVKNLDPIRFVDLCDQLDWKEFVSVIGGAGLVVTVDSVAGHIAAASGTPCIVIGNGLNPPAHWHPLSEVCRVLVHPVPCAPCYRSRGCEGMECIVETTPLEVFEAAVELMQKAQSESGG